MSPPIQTKAMRRRVLTLLGLLSRPKLDMQDEQNLLRMVRSEEWKPVPHLACFHMLEPLILHHLQRAGVPQEFAFQPAPGGQTPCASFTEVALNYARRANVQRDTLAALEHAGVSRVVLIKGSALAPLYPSPALRQMCDLDFVVMERDVEKAASSLRAAGWNAFRHEDGLVWQHTASRLLLDLHVAATDFAMRIHQRAIPHPDFGSTMVCVPNNADHLLLVAMHAANNGGNRVWRDVCDAHLLLNKGRAARTAEAALAEARECSAAVAALAFFRFMNRWCRPAERLPVDAANKAEERLVKARLALYEAFATDDISPAQLGIAKQLFRPVRVHMQAAVRRARKFFWPSPVADARWAEQDPALGLMPAAGSWKRQEVKLHYLAQALVDRRLGHLRRMAALHTESAQGTKVFSAPGE